MSQSILTYCTIFSGNDQAIKLNKFLYGTNIGIAKKTINNTNQMYGTADFFAC